MAATAVPLGLVLPGGYDGMTLGLLALLAGLLALDETAVAQTWFSQPLPAGLLAGYIVGNPAAGLAIGLPLQLALAMNIPVGQSLLSDASTAVVACVGAVTMAGMSPGPLMGSGSDVALTGWLLVGASLLSLAGHPGVYLERRAHFLWALEGHRSLRDGSLARLERIHVRCLLATFGRGSVWGLLGIFLVAEIWLPLYGRLPATMIAGLGYVPVVAAALGLGAVVERYGPRASWKWLGGGVALGWIAMTVAR